jgi:acyl-CoA reductase-like NAD-dependent aldehyde dehydrogenase
LCTEELFAPVATLVPFKEEQEAIALANNTRAGLAAYLFTSNHARAWRAAEALEYGMVAINDGALSSEVAPFGGVKESGLGREGGRQGLEEFLEVKYLMMGGLEGL